MTMFCLCSENEGLPISCAAANGHEELVRYLLDNGGLAGSFPEKVSTFVTRPAKGNHVKLHKNHLLCSYTYNLFAPNRIKVFTNAKFNRYQDV